MRRRGLLAGLGLGAAGLVAMPALAEPCGEEDRRKLLKFGEWLVPGAQACGNGWGTPAPTFFDDFNTLSLFNFQNPGAGGTWQPAQWFAPTNAGYDLNGVWIVNAFQTAQSTFPTYSVAGGVLSMQLGNSPDTTKTGGDSFIGAELTTANTFQHALTGYWEIRCAVPNVAGEFFSLYIQDNSGNQQIDIIEIWSSGGAVPQVGKFSVWDPAPPPSLVSSWYPAGNNQGSFDVTQMHKYGVEILGASGGSAVRYYVDRVLQFSTTLPAGYVNTMFPILLRASGFPDLTSRPSAGALPTSALVDYVGYGTSRPF